MLERRQQIEKRFHDIVEKFRQKGAVSPDKAMTVSELGLPPRFEEAMKRRLGRLGVFVEVDGKYYLSEERLKEIQEQRLAEGEMRNARKRIMTLRLVQLITVIIAIAVLLANLFVQSPELRTVSAVFLVVWVLIMMLQVYYLSRIRRRAL
jgi:hypothetical protein